MKVKRLVILVSIILGGLIVACGASALDWQDEVDVQFTFNPALSISLSSADLVIEELAPGSADVSNEITVTVNTNNITGYRLNATVGDASHDSRNLTHTGGATFASIDFGSSLASLTTPSTWGYSIDAGTTFSGLPKYDDTTNVAVLKTSSAAGSSSTNFLIGANAASSQLSGDYTNVINFTAVTNALPITIANAGTMQNVPTGGAGCPSTLPEGQVYTLKDARDGQKYKVARLADGKCWMLDNLRFDIVAHKDDISSANTNITNSATLTSLMTGNRSAGNNYATAGVSYWTSSYSHSAPLIAIKNASDDTWNPNTTTTSYGSGSGKIGVYYNYCAASAGSYCFGDGTSAGTSEGDAGEDICPAGWRMPTGGANTVATDGKGEYQALYTAYSSNATDFRNALSTPLSGGFSRGSAFYQGSYGYFWSSTRRNDYSMYLLSVYSSGVDPQGRDNRYYGYSVRCLLR